MCLSTVQYYKTKNKTKGDLAREKVGENKVIFAVYHLRVRFIIFGRSFLLTVLTVPGD